MSLWRLEWLRLLRTHRLLAVVLVYLFFGLTGPLTVRYLENLLGALGTGGAQVQFPTPTPADGIAQFTRNASQIGLLVVVLVAAAALAFDSRREMAVFLRSRITKVYKIVLTAYAMSAAAAVSGFALGMLAAWYETAVLLGSVAVADMLLGTLLGAVFLAFAVAVVALSAAVARGTLATAGTSLGILLTMAIVAGLGGQVTGRWMPTTLSGATADLMLAGRPGDYLPATVVTLVATVACLAGAVALTRRREL
ncbi:MAG TPA: hypothetical protein VFC19_50180 [Candidatus Limnocylindrales bacterium]|nr:hypothetical protein [Candidatus Limnocylindrales bacterium]